MVGADKSGLLAAYRPAPHEPVRLRALSPPAVHQMLHRFVLWAVPQFVLRRPSVRPSPSLSSSFAVLQFVLLPPLVRPLSSIRPSFIVPALLRFVQEGPSFAAANIFLVAALVAARVKSGRGGRA